MLEELLHNKEELAHLNQFHLYWHQIRLAYPAYQHRHLQPPSEPMFNLYKFTSNPMNKLREDLISVFIMLSLCLKFILHQLALYLYIQNSSEFSVSVYQEAKLI